MEAGFHNQRRESIHERCHIVKFINHLIMNILIANNLPIPALKYGGTERVIWWLGKELARRGHRITYLVPEGSSCPFAEISIYNNALPLSEQIPKNIDIVHSNFPVKQDITKP